LSRVASALDYPTGPAARQETTSHPSAISRIATPANGSPGRSKILAG
jgi:hypothetical protein